VAYSKCNPIDAKKKGTKEIADWMKDKSIDEIAQRIPGARVVKSLGDKYKKMRAEFEGNAKWSLRGLFDTMSEGVQKAGTAQLDDEFVDRSAGLYERIGNRWRNSALSNSRSEVTSRLKGGGLFGSSNGGREEKSRVYAILNWKDGNSTGVGYPKWFDSGE